jgi:hypothetical protein
MGLLDIYKKDDKKGNVSEFVKIPIPTEPVSNTVSVPGIVQIETNYVVPDDTEESDETDENDYYMEDDPDVHVLDAKRKITVSKYVSRTGMSDKYIIEYFPVQWDDTVIQFDLQVSEATYERVVHYERINFSEGVPLQFVLFDNNYNNVCVVVQIEVDNREVNNTRTYYTIILP